MPAGKRFWLDDGQDIAPCRPKPTEQNPKYSILDSQLRQTHRWPQGLRNKKIFYQRFAARGTSLRSRNSIAP